MMMNHNTTFSNKMFGCLENIRKNIDILTLHCDLDHECSNPFFFFFSQDTQVYDGVAPDQI